MVVWQLITGLLTGAGGSAEPGPAVVVAGGWPAVRKRRRYYVEIDGRAHFFDTLAEARAFLADEQTDTPIKRVRKDGRGVQEPTRFDLEPDEPTRSYPIEIVRRASVQPHTSVHAALRQAAIDQDDEDILLLLAGL